MNSINAILAAAEPYILEALAGILAILIARAAAVARKRWGLDIEARHRDALHTAIMTGIAVAMGRGLSGPAAIDAAITHARASVPDAIRGLAPGAGVLENLAEARLARSSRIQPD